MGDDSIAVATAEVNDGPTVPVYTSNPNAVDKLIFNEQGHAINRKLKPNYRREQRTHVYVNGLLVKLDAQAPEPNATASAEAAPELADARPPDAPGSYQTRPMGAAYLAPARASASATVPGVLSQDNDRLGRIYGRGVLEANWYEERLQAEAGILKGPQDEVPILRPFEPDLSAVQREMTGGLATLSRTKRYPFMLASHSVVSDGFNEHATMSETFYAPLHRRLPNPVEDGITTTSDQMNLTFAQHDSPKTRRSKDRMSNVVDEVRPVADSDAKVRKRFVNAANLGRVYARAPPEPSAYGGFGASVPTHPPDYASRHFSTTTRDALAGGLRGEAAGATTAAAGRPAHVSSGGYRSATTNHTVFTFGIAKLANSQLPGMGAREHFGKTSLAKSLAAAAGGADPTPPALAVEASS